VPFLGRVYELVRRRPAPRYLRHLSLAMAVWKPVRKYLNVSVIPLIPFNCLRILGYRLIGYRIGKRVFIGMRCYMDDFAPSRTTIEDNVTISYAVVFATHGVGVQDREIILRRGCYIGTHATVLGGADVGRWATVAAGALVNKPVPPFAVVAGVPARVLSETPPAGTRFEREYRLETEGRGELELQDGRPPPPAADESSGDAE